MICKLRRVLRPLASLDYSTASKLHQYCVLQANEEEQLQLSDTVDVAHDTLSGWLDLQVVLTADMEGLNQKSFHLILRIMTDPDAEALEKGAILLIPWWTRYLSVAIAGKSLNDSNLQLKSLKHAVLSKKVEATSDTLQLLKLKILYPDIDLNATMQFAKDYSSEIICELEERPLRRNCVFSIYHDTFESHILIQVLSINGSSEELDYTYIDPDHICIQFPPVDDTGFVLAIENLYPGRYLQPAIDYIRKTVFASRKSPVRRTLLQGSGIDLLEFLHTLIQVEETFIGVVKIDIVEVCMHVLLQEDEGISSVELTNLFQNIQKDISRYRRLKVPVLFIVKGLECFLDKNLGVNIRKQTMDLLMKWINEHLVIFVAQCMDPLPTISSFVEKVLAVPIPDQSDRHLILNHYSKSLFKVDSSSLCAQLSFRTPGYTSDQLQKLCQHILENMERRNDHIPNDQDIEFGLQWALASSSYSVEQQHGWITITAKEAPKWCEIKGYDSIIESLKQDIYWPILHTEEMKRLGIQPSKGVLLYGPSGCGKSMLARALASDGLVRILCLNSAGLFSKYLGETEANIRRAFEEARRLSPSIILLDEIDYFGRKRDLTGTGDGVSVQERILTTFLNEMDGIVPSSGVIVVGCTRNPQILDEALLRQGRIDRKIYVGRPDEKARYGILEHYFSETTISSSNLQSAAEMTLDWCASDLEALARNVRLHLLRQTGAWVETALLLAEIKALDVAVKRRIDFERRRQNI